jgi:hypothetical protein
MRRLLCLVADDRAVSASPQEARMRCDAAMTKLPKTSEIRDNFSRAGRSLTDSSTDFTMKPYFGPSRALVAGNDGDS